MCERKPSGLSCTFRYLTQQKPRSGLSQEEKTPDRVSFLLGAGGRTRTDTVSRRILSAVRLPFRHTGICAKGITNIIQQITLAGKIKLKIFPFFTASSSTGSQVSWRSS